MLLLIVGRYVARNYVFFLMSSLYSLLFLKNNEYNDVLNWWNCVPLDKNLPQFTCDIKIVYFIFVRHDNPDRGEFICPFI